VNYAFAACTFFLLKGAFVKAHECIFFKLRAFGAKVAFGSVVAFTVDLYHVPYGLFLSFHSFMFWVRWLRLHVNSSLEQISVLSSHKGLP